MKTALERKNSKLPYIEEEYTLFLKISRDEPTKIIDHPMNEAIIDKSSDE